MGLISLYINDMLRYVLVAAPLYILLRIAYLKTRRATTSLWREVLFALCFLYIVGFFSQTLLPPGHYGFENGRFYADTIISGRYFNLTPLKTLRDYVFGTNDQVGDWDKVSRLNLMANVLLFVPIGFLLPLLRSKTTKLRQIILMGIALSFAIETSQFFLGRRADIDDLILNVLGISAGYVVLRMVIRLRSIGSKPIRPKTLKH